MRRSFLFIAAALLAAVLTAVIGTDLAALHNRARANVTTRVIVIATSDLLLGETVERPRLDVVRVPTGAAPRDALVHIDDAVGRIVRVPVLRGTPLTSRHLAAAVRDALDAAVPMGSRAVHVVVDHHPALTPGTIVDVVAAQPPDTPAAIDSLDQLDSLDPLDEQDALDALGVSDRPNVARVVVAGAIVLAIDETGVTLIVESDAAPTLAIAPPGTIGIVVAPPEANTHRSVPSTP